MVRTIKAYLEPAKTGLIPVAAGWELSFADNGRSAHYARYATKEEAEARIPAVLAKIAAREAEAAKPAPAAAPRGWSNASARRAGRPTSTQRADARRGYTIEDDGAQIWDYS